MKKGPKSLKDAAVVFLSFRAFWDSLCIMHSESISRGRVQSGKPFGIRHSSRAFHAGFAVPRRGSMAAGERM